MTFLENKKTALQDLGIIARVDSAIIGRYYNGHENGLECSLLNCTVYHDESNAGKKIQALESFIKRNKGMKVFSADYSNVYTHYSLIPAAVYESAKQARKTAEAWQESFWQAIHAGKTQAEAVALADAWVNA